MRILIDGHMLGRGEGGNERYIKNLSDALKKFPGIYLKIFVNNAYYRTIPQKEKHFYCSFRHSSDISRYVFDLSCAAYVHKTDIIHTTYFAPLIKNTRIVLTVHDFSFKQYPEFYPAKERFLFSYCLPLSMQRADAIIVPSRFSKKECIRYFSEYGKKIFVTPEAADPVFRQIDKSKAQDYIKKKYRIGAPFLLACNSRNPKKNIGNVIKAYIETQKKHTKLHLVIIGENYNIKQEILSQKNIHIIQHSSDDDLNYFYNACEIFLYCSVYEGFGLPILEALQCGAKVIASDIEAHREVGKNNIVYANPFRIEDLEGKIKKTLLLDCRKAISNSRGLKWRWDATAEKTVEAYKFALL